MNFFIKKIFLISFLGVLFFAVNAQQLTPFLISSTGNYSTGVGISISSSVGEPMTTSLFNTSIILTQGFQQPKINSSIPFSIYVTSTNESCINTNDGSAKVHTIGGVPPFNYFWSPIGSNSDSINMLAPGTYFITVSDSNGASKTDTINIQASQEACAIHIYTGITPNGDGHNDYWQIDNIELHPNNTAIIFNRWGTEVWKGNHYNNNIAWKGNDEQGQALPDGTYFYVLKMDDKTYKGWIQLTR